MSKFVKLSSGYFRLSAIKVIYFTDWKDANESEHEKDTTIIIGKDNFECSYDDLLILKRELNLDE